MKAFKGFIKVTKDIWMMREQDKVVKIVLLSTAASDRTVHNSRLLCEILHPAHGQVDRCSFYFSHYSKQATVDKPAPEMVHDILKYIALYDKDYYESVTGIG